LTHQWSMVPHETLVAERASALVGAQ
jgi:hypothetical protein